MQANPFSAVLGQSQAITLLQQAIQRERIAPGYLFAGPEGVGRKLTAHCFVAALFSQTAPASLPAVQARILKGNHPDLLWVEPTYQYQGQLLTRQEAQAAGVQRKAPPQIRLEQIRQLSRFVARPPLEAPRSIVVLEQAETMAEAAANALLKTLEEPGQASLILLSPAPEALLPTLVSRCQRIPFRALDDTALAQVLYQQGYESICDHPVIWAIAQGSPGEAIRHWQNLQTIPVELLDALQAPPETMRAALELARAIDRGLESEQQLWLLAYLQQRLWQQRQATPTLLRTIELARHQLLSYVQPRLVWEVTLLQLHQQPSPRR
jgi:DNA polymerase III subunit delta'